MMASNSTGAINNGHRTQPTLTPASRTITGREIRSLRSGQLSGFPASDGCQGGGRLGAYSCGLHRPTSTVCDNYSTHKSPTILKWLESHRPFHVYFTPRYSSWINQVEHFFAYGTADLLQVQTTAASRRANPTSATGSRAGTRTRSHSSGPNTQNRSSNPSNDFYNALPAEDSSSVLIPPRTQERPALT